ncbi:nucleoporin GLE1-like isoform X2 [Gouania willdenowi]|nr:nucleoporin GLE1-like isoform X2 [Gouania willdenowi]
MKESIPFLKVKLMMPSENQRWETLQAIKNSPKGRIKSDPHWSDRGENILAGYVETLSLSLNAGLILKKLSPPPPPETPSLASSSGCSTPGLSQGVSTFVGSNGTIPSISNQHLIISVTKESVQPQATSDGLKLGSPLEEGRTPTFLPSPPTLPLLSPRDMEMNGCIMAFEEEQREKAKAAVRKRQQQLEETVLAIAAADSEQLKRIEELMELKQRQENQMMRDLRDRETKESMGRQEQLKEAHRHRIKILNMRVWESEQQRVREAELERQRQAEGRERLNNLNNIQEEILQLNQLLDPSTHITEHLLAGSLSSYTTRGNQLCSQVSEVVHKTAEGEFPGVEDMMVAKQALHNMKTLIQQMQEEAVSAQEEKKKRGEEEEHRKQVALQQQKEAEKKAAESSKEKAQRKGLQNRADGSTMKWFRDLQTSLSQCAQSFEQLSSSRDKQTKKIKMELQKTATTPVCQISPISGSLLRGIFDKIDNLLSGRSTECGGKSVSTSLHPQGLNFVSYKIAEKFVRLGEEEVASNHKAAFPIAVVASGIWELHPKVGDLILAHLHKSCPYSIPHYPPMKDGMSVKEYQEILGYHVDESGVENQDQFLKRMSGMIRLYAAIVQLRWPFGSKQEPVPHGLNHGWRWLAQVLNMAPVVDITATLLYDFLEVCGNALIKQYQNQFWKLILLLKEEYLPRIEAITSIDQMGSVTRLKEFIEASLQKKRIDLPEGHLTSSFWRL